MPLKQTTFENIVAKEELLETSNFLFCHNVFNSTLLVNSHLWNFFMFLLILYVFKVVCGRIVVCAWERVNTFEPILPYCYRRGLLVDHPSCQQTKIRRRESASRRWSHSCQRFIRKISGKINIVSIYFVTLLFQIPVIDLKTTDLSLFSFCCCDPLSRICSIWLMKKSG